MTYSTHELDRLATGETVFSADVSAPVRHIRRRRHDHIMNSRIGGVRISGLGL